MTLKALACPCCGSGATGAAEQPGYRTCAACMHAWRSAKSPASETYYRELDGRNDTAAPWFRHKLADRSAALSDLIALIGARSVLEIGCAEGALGKRVRQQSGVCYQGIELSHDADTAAGHLDAVFRCTAADLDGGPYDIVTAFHVLEHIPDVESEIRSWTRLLAPAGRMLVEVPHRAGHPLLTHDHNREHLHQFSLPSLACLLERHGLEIESISRGHVESPVYPDSLRVTARIRPTPEARRTALIERFRRRLAGPFLVYGIGGDFENYVRPLVDALPVAALLDSSTDKQGTLVDGRRVQAYAEDVHGGLPILVSSIRFGEDIKRHLRALGIEEARIVALSDVYDPA